MHSHHILHCFLLSFHFGFSSLGVHISFVRSIAMDSWTDKQMALMKAGGNDNCNNYLKAKGIDARTPIKQKYESDHAQLYKAILLAKVEGRPEPTSLPPPKKKTPYQSQSAPNSLNTSRPMAGAGGAPAPAASTDVNGMERLAGENDQQYIARQTRLREEAKVRMAAKFGGSGRPMGGVGSSGGGGGGMQGIGSNPNYNPGSGYGAGDVMGSVSSVFSSGFSLVGGAANSVSSYVQDDQTKAAVGNMGATATNVAGSFWSSLSSAANNVASTITQQDGDDGLEALQREFSSNRPAQSKYGGFGSQSSAAPTGGNSNRDIGSMLSAAGGIQECPGLPTEDRNGMERLSGETDEQYVMRQNRLSSEAKARMAAKFGGGGMGSASSTSARPSPAPSSGNFASAPASGGLQLNAAPRSGGFGGVTPAPRSNGVTPPRKSSKESFSGDDFFSSFGT
jgi:hypothetical protein